MTLKDMDKLNRLHKTFELNFKLTRLYALYLEHFPEVINSEMINALTGDGSMDEREAVIAILCELFGLSLDGNADERRLVREYVMPSVRILDAEKYRNNPYYNSIKIPNVKNGRWELKQEQYPAYRGVVCGDVEFCDGMREVVPIGFFKENFAFPAVLEDGNEWMTLTPVDLDTCEDAIEKAHGRVVTFGLGLGYYAFMVSKKHNVESITVVEKSRDVIELFRTYILPQFSNPEKVIIVEDDAFSYAERVMPGEGFDVAFVDTWRDASDGAPMYARMKNLEHLNPNTEFLYWIENFLISRLRAERYGELCEMLDKGERGAPQSYDEFLDRLDK